MFFGIDDRITFAVLGGLLTLAITRVIDFLRVGDQVRELAKAVAIPLLELGRALEQHSRMLDAALAGDDDKLRGYYKFVLELVPQSAFDELRARTRESVKLPHDAIVQLRTADGQIEKVQIGTTI